MFTFIKIIGHPYWFLYLDKAECVSDQQVKDLNIYINFAELVTKHGTIIVREIGSYMTIDTDILEVQTCSTLKFPE